jgi:hypothetical protein
MRLLGPMLCLWIALAGAPARACPDCDTALAARARVARDDVAWRLSIAVLPFAISAFAALWLGSAIDRRRIS